MRARVAEAGLEGGSVKARGEPIAGDRRFGHDRVPPHLKGAVRVASNDAPSARVYRGDLPVGGLLLHVVAGVDIPAVVHLDAVNVGGDTHQRPAVEHRLVALLVVGVRDVNGATLAPDLGDGLLGREPGLYALREPKSDNLPFRGEDFFADNHRYTPCLEPWLDLQRALDFVVVGYCEAINARPPAPTQ